MKKLIFIISILFICLQPKVIWAAVGPNWIEQWGITWTFDKDILLDGAGDTYQYGQYANGDYWVKGPVNIVAINPPSHVTVEGEQDEEGRVFETGTVINGSMINPAEHTDQGWIDMVSEVSFLDEYREELNVAFGISAQDPLVISGNKSLVSMISRVYTVPPLPATRIKRAAILTVVDTVPDANSFRPSYAGTDKTIYSANNLNYSIFSSLPRVQSTPSLSELEDTFEKPWIDHVGSATGRLLHPADNMPNYGAGMSRAIGTAALMLNLDFTNQEKEKLLIRFVQYSIDLWGVYKTGRTSNWLMQGGHGPGRKLPILLAGYVLNDPEMAAIGSHDLDDPYFGEDHVTLYLYRDYVEGFIGDDGKYPANNLHRDYEDAYYIDTDYTVIPLDSATIPVWNSTILCIRNEIKSHKENYYRCKKKNTNIEPGVYEDWAVYWAKLDIDNNGNSCLGLPEYAKTYPSGFQGRWISKRENASYRTNWGWPIHEVVLAVHIMGLKQAWNNDALFDYTDRYVAWIGGLYGFREDMWNTYRAQFGAIWPEKDPVPDSEPQPQPNPDTEPETEVEQEIEEDAVNNVPDQTLLRISNNIIKSGGNQAVTINCDVKDAGTLTVKIYDAKGREIITLWNKHEEPGTVPVTWTGKDSGGSKVGSGIYLIHMEIGNYKETKKIAIVK